MIGRLDVAKLVPWSSLPLRLFLGLAFMGHGAQKLLGAFGGPGIDGTAQFFRSTGIPQPELSAWLVGGVELVGGLLLALGLVTRIAAAVLSVVMLVAALAVHASHGFFAQAGGMEMPLAYLAGLLSLICFGGGALSLDAYLASHGTPMLPFGSGRSRASA